MNKLDTVKQHPLFNQLTERQQKFTVAFIETQEKAGSIQSAGYVCKTTQTAVMLARKNLKHPVIKQLVALGLGYEPAGGILAKSEVLLRMSDHIRTTNNTTEFSRLVILYTRLRGWIKDKDGIPELNKVVERMERRRKEIGKP